MTTDKTPADVLDDAADIILMRGRVMGGFGVDGGPRCALGAIAEAQGISTADALFPQRCLAAFELGRHLTGHFQVKLPGVSPHLVADWNDLYAKDDFEVIDTMRTVAKTLRNEAVPT